jgi:hypothetical protein
MGKLAPPAGPNGPRSTGIMAAPRPPQNTPKPKVTSPFRACDQCGYTKNTGQPICRAKYQVETINGSLYFCTHHFRVHEAALMRGNYRSHLVV